MNEKELTQEEKNKIAQEIKNNEIFEELKNKAIYEKGYVRNTIGTISCLSKLVKKQQCTILFNRTGIYRYQKGIIVKLKDYIDDINKMLELLKEVEEKPTI